jgi:hypothetical protein
METWKPVLGFESLYEVSNFGNIRRKARGKIFSANQIEIAKQMFHKGSTLKQVAEFLQTSITTAHCIKTGKTWKGDAEFRPCKVFLLKGYLQISLCKNGVYFKKAAHRIVWEAFNGLIPGRMEINHKDLNRSNNNLNNLELTTHQQNVKHAIDLYKSRGLLRAVKGKKGFIAGKHSVYDNS